MLEGLLILVGFIVFLTIYFAPSIIARFRKHQNLGALLALNIFLGWTCLGWVGSLVWALMRQAPANFNTSLRIPESKEFNVLKSQPEL